MDIKSLHTLVQMPSFCGIQKKKCDQEIMFKAFPPFMGPATCTTRFEKKKNL